MKTNNKYRIKLKKNVKYSICSCGLSEKLPYCDNGHRIINNSNNTKFNSIKVYCKKDVELELICKKWHDKKNKS